MAGQKNSKPTFAPEAYCGICGVEYQIGHRCSKGTLGAIDAANTRALRQELIFEPFKDTRNMNTRLKNGFDWMNPDGDLD
ncbi:hypothetical protein HOA55_04770 [archaeon]|jgi:hypothetical protein|nr:hypothetical protein [archaeon]MBT3578094.1 hypothetical protein [archaeon]MBT6820642.1 hypothetical protein [archaeon]MBT6956489.1 hypothetical protein [archaeon]MBT7024948.1 hypothetical protein [archaeon]